MHSARSVSAASAAAPLDRRVGVEREACPEPERARERGGGRDVRASFDVERDAVPAGFADLLEVALGVVDHQMAVEPSAGGVHDRRERPNDDRPDRDRRDEAAVSDVDVEDPRARGEQLVRSAARAAGSRRRRPTARSRLRESSRSSHTREFLWTPEPRDEET